MKEDEEGEMSVASTLLHHRTFTPTTTMLLVRGRRLRSSCPGLAAVAGGPTPAAATATVRRVAGEPKRRAFIPISSRQTSRVLNNVELDERRMEVRVDDSLPFVARRRTVLNGSVSSPMKECCAQSTCSTDSSSDGSAEISSVESTSTGHSSLPTIADGRPADWACLRTPPSRYSASSFGSSCSAGSEEDIWVPRKNF